MRGKGVSSSLLKVGSFCCVIVYSLLAELGTQYTE